MASIYVPDGQVKVNGNGGTLIVDQIIAGTYDINGNGGTDQGPAESRVSTPSSCAAGLVE